VPCCERKYLYSILGSSLIAAEASHNGDRRAQTGIAPTMLLVASIRAVLPIGTSECTQHVLGIFVAKTDGQTRTKRPS
jgi:hypothetical protein